MGVFMEKKLVKYALLALLASYLAKSLILGAGLNEVLLVAILSALISFSETKLSNKKTIELQNQLDELTNHNKEQDKSIDDLKSSIVSVKVSSGIRGLTR